MATFEPWAATHGYTDAPALTSVRGADQVAPQSLDCAYLIRLDDVPSSSSQTAASLLPPAFATTGNAAFVVPEDAGPTGTWEKVRPPFVERAKFTPPVDVA